MDYMNVTEISQLIDKFLSEQNRRPLNNIQKAILEGSWQGQSYQEIGKEYHRSESHVREEGAKLWQLVSEVLGEDIKKSNFRSSLERIYIKSSGKSSNIYNINRDNNHVCYTQTLSSINENPNNGDINLQCQPNYYDLTSAPQILEFYDRETELQTLNHWLFNSNTRLISVLAVLGMGKTTLVKKLVDLNLDQFDIIIWKSLKFPKSLDLLLEDLLSFCQQNPQNTLDAKLRQLLEILTHKKCLIILDDFQNLFAIGQMAGYYQSEYSDYQNLIKLITDIKHQSHIILISQEKCSEINCFNQDNSPIQCLELSGIKTAEILQNKGLEDEERWLQLIQLYEGNPFYLKEVAILIQDIFDGKVADFLAEHNLIITKKMQFHLKQVFERCSPIAQKIILELSKIDESLSREDLKNALQLSSGDLINGLQSLQQRYLIAKLKGDQPLFKLSPIFKEYIKTL
jgi:hypothetical protein